MNQETITAERIYYKIQRLKEELMELGKAKNLLYDEQNGGVAHSLVKKVYDEKNQELHTFQRTKFVEVVPEVELSTDEKEGGLTFP